MYLTWALCSKLFSDVFLLFLWLANIYKIDFILRYSEEKYMKREPLGFDFSHSETGTLSFYNFAKNWPTTEICSGREVPWSSNQSLNSGYLHAVVFFDAFLFSIVISYTPLVLYLLLWFVVVFCGMLLLCCLPIREQRKMEIFQTFFPST